MGKTSEPTQVSRRFRTTGRARLKFRGSIVQSSSPATDRARAEYLRDPQNLLAVAVDRVTRGVSLTDAEIRDFTALLDEEKGNLQMVLAAATTRNVARLRPIGEAIDAVFARIFTTQRLDAASTYELLAMAGYLESRNDKITDALREIIGQVTPRHLTNIILQQNNEQHHTAIAGRVQDLDPTARSKLRVLLELLPQIAERANGQPIIDIPATSETVGIRKA